MFTLLLLQSWLAPGFQSLNNSHSPIVSLLSSDSPRIASFLTSLDNTQPATSIPTKVAHLCTLWYIFFMSWRQISILSLSLVGYTYNLQILLFSWPHTNCLISVSFFFFFLVQSASFRYCWREILSLFFNKLSTTKLQSPRLIAQSSVWQSTRLIAAYGSDKSFFKGKVYHLLTIGQCCTNLITNDDLRSPKKYKHASLVGSIVYAKLRCYLAAITADSHSRSWPGYVHNRGSWEDDSLQAI